MYLLGIPGSRTLCISCHLRPQVILGGTGRGEGAVLERGATAVVFPGPTQGGCWRYNDPIPNIKHLSMVPICPNYVEFPHVSRAVIIRGDFHESDWFRWSNSLMGVKIHQSDCTVFLGFDSSPNEISSIDNGIWWDMVDMGILLRLLLLMAAVDFSLDKFHPKLSPVR